MLSQEAIYKRILDSFLDTQCTIIQSVWPGGFLAHRTDAGG